LHGQDTCRESPGWYRTTLDGRPLSTEGKPVNEIANAAQILGKDLAGIASVRPITHYFVNPTEMLSEGLTAYRAGRETRSMLLRESPSLYKTAQQYDQKEIATCYGADSSGRPNYVRTPEGYIVKRERATVSSITQFEDHTRRMKSLK